MVLKTCKIQYATDLLQRQESIEKPYTIKELLLKKGLIYDDKSR